MSWVAPVVAGIVFWNGLYLLLRNGLIRLIFDPLFRKFYRSPPPPTPSSAHKDESNGVVQNGVSPSEKTRLTDGEVVEMSERVETFIFNVVIAACSLVFMWQSRSDIMLARSSALVSATHFTTPYFVHDLRAMFHSVVAKKNLYNSSFSKKFTSYLQKHWAFIIHHLILIFLGYPLAIDYFNWRGGKGDFIIGAFFAHDIANPFLVINLTLKVFNCHKTTFAIVSGIIGIITFFFCRVIKWPLVLLVYAAQYHSYNVFAAVFDLYLVCYVCMLLDGSLCAYWFHRIITVASQSFKSVKSD